MCMCMRMCICMSSIGIRQGAASSAYIFNVFVNGLFQYLRAIYGVNPILGIIHNLIHADDTIILATSYNVFKAKITSPLEFVDGIDQRINLRKTKYMCIDNLSRHVKEDLYINNFHVEYSEKEKYLGQYLTDQNSLQRSIELDIEERAANAIVKLRNFINNNKNTSLEIRSAIPSNCETWGQWIPKTVTTLYHQGLKLSLGIRKSTPTALMFLEIGQPSVTALIRKRQLKFWISLNEDRGTELHNVLKRVNTTLYVTYYKKLETQYANTKEAFVHINKDHYTKMWNEVKNATQEKTKLKLYHQIHNNCDLIPCNSLSLQCLNQKYNKIFIEVYNVFA